MTSRSASRADALVALGLSEPCSSQEIAAAYRRLARATHPDATGDPDAVDRFTALTDAYHLLRSSSSPSSDVPPPPPLRLRTHDPLLVAEGRSRPPIVAGPVRIRPLPPRPRGSA